MHAVPSDSHSDRLLEPLGRVLGTRTANALAKLGLETTGDLLRHYPRRYAEPGKMTDMSALIPGEHVTVVARIERATVRRMHSRGGAMLQAVVTDGYGRLDLTYFGKSGGALRVHESRLVPGRVGMFTGTVGEYRGARQLTHPDYVIIGENDDVEDEAAALIEVSRPVPIYPAGASIPTWRIQRAVRTVLDPLTEAELPDPIPAELRAKHGYGTLLEALRDVHEPFSTKQARRGLARLRYEEALVLQTELARRRAHSAVLNAIARPPRAERDGASSKSSTPSLLADFDARLPFALTAGQREVGEQIASDLAQPHPMQRLLQGDVGSGKTVVAVRAMLQVVDAGGQAVLLAPTEVLAAQHARTLRALLGDLADTGLLGGPEHGTRIALLTGSLSAAERKQTLLDAASGAAGIVVGTHALLGDKVQFAELGLVVVDEQHRFGVEQRDALRTRALVSPHLLVMTATPIPRTVAMTVFGDLEISVLSELPAGRAAITTHVVPAARPKWVARTWAVAREQVDRGNRVYVVCPRIDAAPDPASGTISDDGFLTEVGEEPAEDRPPLRAVTEVFDELQDRPELAGIPMAMLHGRMLPADRDRVMADFASGAVRLLVSTTVIEVGVDVPEATVMVILDADRFGISQLHQLRGRVGRSDRPSLCMLISSAAEDSVAAERLLRLAQTPDGFELAQLDFETRREGDVLGAAQSGAASSLRLLRVVRDAKIIARARADAEEIIAADLELADHPNLRGALADRLSDRSREFIDRA